VSAEARSAFVYCPGNSNSNGEDQTDDQRFHAALIGTAVPGV
jgi:hypothetical protein